MIVYMDTSVVLSRLLGQKNALEPWGGWDKVLTSVLTSVEFLRTIDRLRLENNIDDRERTELHGSFRVLWETMCRVPLAESILRRAAEPFPTVLGTLDALHLASALIGAQDLESPPCILTHDEQLARAASAMGFEVAGTT